MCFQNIHLFLEISEDYMKYLQIYKLYKTTDTIKIKNDQIWNSSYEEIEKKNVWFSDWLHNAYGILALQSSMTVKPKVKYHEND